MQVNPQLLKLIPVELIKKYQVMPMAEEGQNIVVGMTFPYDLQIIDDLCQLTGRNVLPRQMSKEEISVRIKRYYIDDYSANQIGDKPTNYNYDNKVAKFLDSTLAKAVNEGASDIHFEPEQNGWRVRFRIDGILIELIKPQAENYLSIISRLKIVAGLDIAKKREPMEGRFQQQINGRAFDFRLVTMPALYGEKAVLRILDKETIGFTLDKLGFTAEDLQKLNRILKRPQGLTLITGPTGSGKTTTLYAILKQLMSPEKSITTLEDPIEYTLPGIIQIPINQDNGIAYAEGLRSLLRQDPDIIMIGEIRDGETARIALRAAVTGHTVLATIHTTSAPQAITRLLDLGVEPYRIKSGLIGVISQRLVRKVCRCDKGCISCNYTGYSGRTSIQEVLEITPELEKKIKANFEESDFIKIAENEGFISLVKAGKLLCAQGITTTKELARVIYCS